MNRLFRIVLVLVLPVIAVAALLISNDQANPRQSYEVSSGRVCVLSALDDGAHPDHQTIRCRLACRRISGQR